MFPLFRSLRTKLIVMLVLLLSLLALATGLATLSAMKQESEMQARQILTVAAKVLRQALDVRAEQLTNSVRVLSADFGFRRAVATTEQETIESVLANHGARINAQLALLLTPQGHLLASSGAEVNEDDIAPLFRQTSSKTIVADTLLIAGQPYQLVLAPVNAPTLIAWVGMGFPLDYPMALQIKGITDLDVSFSSQQINQQQILTSTLPDEHQQQINAMLPLIKDPASLLTISTDQLYTSEALPLNQSRQLWAVLHLSNERWFSRYQQFRQQLVTIFLVGLSFALLMAFVFARSITQPLSVLTRFAKRIGEGKAVSAPLGGNDEVGLLSRTLTAMQQDILLREQQLLHNAEHDGLTGLQNRTAIERQLQHDLQQFDGCLLQLNIHQFKHINDVLGFSNGDLLLQQLGKRLQQCQPRPHLLARLGGDEFLLVFNFILLPEQVTALLQPLTHGFSLDRSVINLTLYAGVYNFTANTLNANDALRRVDIALDNARQQPSGIGFYQQGQDESHQRELTLIRDLPAALAQGQFFAVYQPKVDIQRPACDSAEALIRWQHPEFGMIPPDQFISLAEHSGNISLITDWMLQHVIAQGAAWWHAGLHIQIAVNLSVFDLLNPALPQSIHKLLIQHKLPPQGLALEVTEGAVMQDTLLVIAHLQQLRSLGIRLAIDDFGTGQSSLAYLKQLPVHEVKIDRAFVKDIEHNNNDELIVQATVQLAHSLGFSVTAEGLENHAGLSCLQNTGCDKVQGYYFSRPLPAAEFHSWLQTFKTDDRNWFYVENTA